MSILDITLPQQTASAQTTGGARTERKPSEFWLNVGVRLKGMGKPDPVTGEATDLFVNLPNGLPLDDMKPAKVSGTNVDYIHLQQTKNAVLEQLQKAAAGLKPGERMRVPLLEVEIYRKNDAEATGNAADNPLLAALFGQGGGLTAGQ